MFPANRSGQQLRAARSCASQACGSNHYITRVGGYEHQISFIWLVNDIDLCWHLSTSTVVMRAVIVHTGGTYFHH